jgi:hypothetical protein
LQPTPRLHFSTAYSVALCMLKVGKTPPRVQGLRYRLSGVRDFAGRVTVKETPDLNDICAGPLSVRGQGSHERRKTFEEIVVGTAEKPLSSAMLDDKFHSQVAGGFGAQRCESLDDLARLPPMLVACPGQPALNQLPLNAGVRFCRKAEMPSFLSLVP